MTKWGKRGFGSKLSSILKDILAVFQTKPTRTWKKRQVFQAQSTMKYVPKGMNMKASKQMKPVFSLQAFMTSQSKRPRIRKVWSFKRKLLAAMIVFFIITIPTFIFIEQNLREPLMHVAKMRIKQLATQAINQAITEQVAQQSQVEQLIDWKMDSNGKVSGFMLNYSEHMKITSSTINTVQQTLTDLQHIPERIPIGHALDSAIISNYGPKIPVDFEPVGAVKVELNTREKNAAINMVLVEVYIKVITEIAIIIPFDAAPEVVEAEIPISYLLVVGDVPMYYYDSKGNAVGESAPQAPNISVPLQQGAGISSNHVTGDALPENTADTSGTVLTTP